MKELLEILNEPSDDYWFAEGGGIARSIIDENAPKLFCDLLKMWKSMAVMQQERLAYLLEAGGSDVEDDLISDMLTSENKEVAYRAWEAQCYRDSL